MTDKMWGYMGKLLRVDLTEGTCSDEPLDPNLAEQYLGGTGLGVEYLYREVSPGVEWDDPRNIIVMASGPVGGTLLAGTGTFSLVTKGPMTNLGIATQANGFWGAYLKSAGYDGVIIQGQSSRWVYLSIAEGKVELRDGSPLLGKDTWDMENAVRDDLKITEPLSVFGIGLAGENKVRFAVVAGDEGHICSKGGCGCVMGAKRLKAVAVTRGKQAVPIFNKELFREKAKALLDDAKTAKGGNMYKWGTGAAFSILAQAGALPIRNYSTNVFPEHEQMNSQYIRTHFEHKNKPCWACGMIHTKYMKVTEGPFTGYEGEEPEYEGMAGWGPQIGNKDPGAYVKLSNITDRLGLDFNEASWIVGWVMECYEKGILTKDDLDGLDMRWGNVEATEKLLEKISRREGVGDLLAEGVKRASEKLGGDAPNLGIYVLKGSTPRGHDHRGMWQELLDTCVSATGTLQSGGSRQTPPTFFGEPPVTNDFSPWEVAGVNAKMEGWLTCIDSLGICRFITTNPQLTIDCLNAVTGANLTLSEARAIGRRIVNQLRVFNFRHGLDPALEVPSPRYGSMPVDGPAQGKAIGQYFEWMKTFYFELMGWDAVSGLPLPHTLKSLGLERLIPDLERNTTSSELARH
jgi:aldehyde:ferredoxin oxidoreductase